MIDWAEIALALLWGVLGGVLGVFMADLIHRPSKKDCWHFVGQEICPNCMGRSG